MLLWERKLQLEREMRAALEAGPDSTSAVEQAEHDLRQAEVRHADLLKTQERLMGQMEAAIGRRDAIATKVGASASADSLCMPACSRLHEHHPVVDA